MIRLRAVRSVAHFAHLRTLMCAFCVCCLLFAGFLLGGCVVNNVVTREKAVLLAKDCAKLNGADLKKFSIESITEDKKERPGLAGGPTGMALPSKSIKSARSNAASPNQSPHH